MLKKEEKKVNLPATKKSTGLGLAFLSDRKTKEEGAVWSKVVKNFLKVGKKAKAENLLSKAVKKVELTLTPTLSDIRSPGKKNANAENPKAEGCMTLSTLLIKSLTNIESPMRLQKVRVAGRALQKPVPLTRIQSQRDAIKRLLNNALNKTTRSEKSASLRLSKEIEEVYTLLTSNKSLNELRELHKAAEANKANLSLK